MTNDMSIPQGLAIDFANREVVATLKATVAIGLSEPEFKVFAEYCRTTGLNPFKKEVWAIKAGGRLQIMTGINGFLTIANKHPQFDGMTVEVDNDEKPTRAVCKVYRKDRKFPSEGVALMKEYYNRTPIWDGKPRVMLTKVAKSIALREAFPQELGGLYTPEEMPTEYGLKQAPINITETYKPAQIQNNNLETEPVNQENFETVSEPVQDDSSTIYYKLYPGMDGFDVWKAKIKQAGGIWNAEHKNWSVKAKIPGLERQEMTATGEYVHKTKKPIAKKPVEPVQLVEDVKIEEAPPFDDDDLPF